MMNLLLMKLWFCRLCNNQQWTRNHGRHMLEKHATQTFCTLCHVDMRTPFALNVHMEEHTNACGSEKVTYGARAAHARKHRALAQDICDSVVTEHAQKKRTRQQDTDEIPASASGIRSSSDDRAAERVSAEAKVQKHMYMSDDDSQDAPDDVNRDASYQPGRDQKQAIQKKKRQKVEAVKPSGRLLRSQSKKSREIGRVFS
ncbi:unnamed protein product [Acanthoscelides obtectus]|uniref:C2H2-type domain-containing protein n=1 Tax=Acanthoscelides obtectus TaxID=200917 RepID=A0A9P0JZF6_ACAOB|nr:unnamed protein product [Acanthoscelides obtectus]CAK1638031.1 hypothetical protein AOBTE_LOCUS10351 [Acanthoscelides obtectus]